jgi:hypothetical protein
VTHGRDMAPAVNNLFCGAYYMLKIVSHQYLGHKSYRKIKKILNHVEGALFVMVLTLIFWRFELVYQLKHGWGMGKVPVDEYNSEHPFTKSNH